MNTCQGSLPKLREISCGQKINSGAHISSVAEGVQECVSNSLDAEATEIHVEVDAATFSFKVSDNGLGLPYDSLSYIPKYGATSKIIAQENLQPRFNKLGFRGHALAAVCETATVEISSRAAGTFETYNKVITGGQVVKFGLAMEQHYRQGTKVLVRDMFFNMPVKRKALISIGLQKEADRCRQSVFRLALLRPEVTFTVYDKARKSFILRLIKNRDPLQQVKEIVGEPVSGSLAVVNTGSKHGFEVSGYAVLPPYGHANASRQYVFVNGRPVEAKPLCKMVDKLFMQLYKANDQFDYQGSDLISQRKARNRHAQFVLNIQCGRAEYEVSAEPDKALVEFRDWHKLLATVQLAILQAWKPMLTVACLNQLSELESKEGGDGKEGSGAAPAAQLSREAQDWGMGAASLGWTQGAGRATVASRRACKQATPVAPPGTADQRGSRLAHSGPMRRTTRSGFAHSLTSRLIGFGTGNVKAVETGCMEGEELGNECRLLGQKVGRSVGQPQDEGSHLIKRRKDRTGTAAWLEADYDLPLFLSPASTASKVLEPEVLHQSKSMVDRPAAGRVIHSQHQNNVVSAHASGQLLRPDMWASPCSSWLVEDGSICAAGQEFRGGRGCAAASGGSPMAGGEHRQWQDRNRGMELVDAWRPLSPPALAPIHKVAWPLQACDQNARQTWSSRQRPCIDPELRIAPTEDEQRLLAAVSGVPPAAARTQLRRPSSAPPQPKRRSRAVHTNPGISLHAALPQGAAPAQHADLQVTAEGKRGRDTVSGVRAPLRTLHATAKQTDASLSAGGPPSTGTLLWWGQQRKSSQPSQQASKTSGSAAAVSHVSRGLHQASRATALQPSPASYTPPASPPMPQSVGPAPCSNQSMGGTGPPAHARAGALLSSWQPAAAAGSLPTAASLQEEPVLQLEAVERSVFAQLKPGGLTRGQLQSARALAQVDRKFVPVVCGSLVALVDQHAADERVQLERLRDQLVGGGTKPLQQSVLRLSPPHPLHLSHSQLQLMEMYGEKLRAWGWEWCGGGLDGGEWMLTHAPVVLGTALTATDMTLFLHHLEDTCGAGGIPSGVVRVLNSKACRGAIMFGDELLPVQCQNLVDDLKQTQLYNSCAHGRPTLAPLVDMQKLQHARNLRSFSQLSKAPPNGSETAGLCGLASRLRKALHQIEQASENKT